MKKNLFQGKIAYLFDELKFEGREKEFVAWFSKKGHNYSARKKVVINKWLLGEMSQNSYSNFNDFPICQEKIDGVLAFPKDCFSDTESLEAFKSRVDSYGLQQPYKTSQKFEFAYKYIYYYETQLKEIIYANIEIIEEVSPKKKYKIKITPPKIYKDRVNNYEGYLKIDEHGSYQLSTRNDVETINSYFVENRTLNSTHNHLYGLTLRRSYDKKLPIAHKNMMTKKIVDTQEQTGFNLLLNELNLLSLEDDIFNVDTNIEQTVLNKFQKEIANLNTFLGNAKNLLNNDPYLNIFYDAFFSLYEASNFIKADKRYWVSNKREAYKIFLESTAQKKESTCYIVNPIYDSYIYLFDEDSPSLVNLNVQSAKKGLKIEHIFVVTREYEITNLIQKTVKKLESNGIVINFVLLDEIEKIAIDSYDFLCTNHNDVALYRNIYAHKYFYNITKFKDKTEKLLANYKKIKQISYSMNAFLIEQKSKNDKTLKRLVGKWYHYYYGSQKYKNKYKIWKSKLIIEGNGIVTYIDKEVISLKGEINTTFNPSHPFIYLTGTESATLALIQLDSVDIYRGIFKAPFLDKKLSSSLNMASIGFFSKKELEDDTIQKILGNDENGIVLEDDKMQDRIIEYYNESLEL